MKFKNYKNTLERPFIVYADFECLLIPTDMSDKIARHEPNSASCYFVCTFDSSRNKLWNFEGSDCVVRSPLRKRTTEKRKDDNNR